MIRLLRHDDTVHGEDDGAERFDDLAEIVQVKVCGYFVMVNSSMDQLLGNGRWTKEKVPVLLEPQFFGTFLVLPEQSTDIRR